MRLEIKGKETQNAVVRAPRSKSMAHRLLICAGLADGTSIIRGIDISDDTLATIDCLQALGADISLIGEDGRSSKDIELSQDVTLEVKGIDPFSAESARLHCRESSSTLRFMAPVSTLSGGEMTLSGSRTLMSRPMSVYEELFTEKGLKYEMADTAMLVQGSLPPGTYTVPGNISSQFISGLLFALPLLGGDSRIVIEGRAESRPYIEMTLEVLSKFGVWAGWEQDGSVLAIPGGQKYKAQDVDVEGDWSGASYLLALGAQVTGLEKNSTQGDKACVEYFRQLDEGQAEIDITDCPDLGPVLAAYAAGRHGCRLTGTKRLRYKESDRAAVLQEELAKFGIDTVINENSISVSGGASAPSESLCGHNDHRIVMALAVLCAETGGVIDGAEAVNKSFPDFFDKLAETGVNYVREN